MTKPNKIGFAVIGALIAALAADYFGGRWRAGGVGGRGTDVSTASWMATIKSKGELRVGCADSPPRTVVADDGTCSGPVAIPLQDLAGQTSLSSWALR